MHASLYIHEFCTVYGKTFEWENFLRLGYKIVIHGKPFVLACLLTYTANRQGHNLWETFAIE